MCAGVDERKKNYSPLSKQISKKIFRIKRVSSDWQADMSVKDRTAETTPTVKTNESRYNRFFFDVKRWYLLEKLNGVTFCWSLTALLI